MSNIIGLDFGSHLGSVAIWNPSKYAPEVIVNDLGSRTVPVVISFREDEIIIGEAALSQSYKNIPNTFSNIRSQIIDNDINEVYVPVLDKTVTIHELASYYFSNIYTQVKQYTNTLDNECIIAIPSNINEISRKRIEEAAKAGGLVIKSFIDDAIATLLTYGFDNYEHDCNIIIFDAGWSNTEISIYNSKNGLLSHINSLTIEDLSGLKIVQLLTQYCASEYYRKYKLDCNESKKSLGRLTKECEIAIRSLSTMSEVTIDVDSLHEGVDFSTRISRARFEDLLTKPFQSLQSAINQILVDNNLNTSDIQHICLSGGICSLPKFTNVIKSILSTSTIAKTTYDYSEVQCIGAALHGQYLKERSKLEEGHSLKLQPVPTLKHGIDIIYGENKHSIKLFQSNTVLPFSASVPVQLIHSKTILTVVVHDSEIVLGQIVTSNGENESGYITGLIDAKGEISITIENDNKTNIFGSLIIPAL